MKSTTTILLLTLTLNVLSQVKKLFDREVMYQHFSGVALVESTDSVILSYSQGWATAARRIGIETTFDIGSITKQFTAAAILHLVEDRRFNLQDRINPVLGKYASDRWDKVTVHQLLTHTSGIPSVYQTEQGLEIFFAEEVPIELEDLIGRFKDGKLLFSPGEEFSYSNSGYILLAAIIEQASRKSYEEYMADMFEKYGLQSTSFKSGQNSAKPFYGYRGDLVREAPVNHPSWYIGAGGIYSSVKDLSRWIDVVQSESFLTKDLRNKYLKAHTNSGYGYGWVHSKDVIEHDGGNAGFMSHLSFNPETGERVIILTNRSFEDIKSFGKSADYVKGLVDKCWRALNGDSIDVLPKIEDMKMPERLSFESGITIRPSDSVLLITQKANNPARIVPNTPLEGKNELEIKMLDIAKCLKKKKYWSLAGHCDGEMKFVMYSGMMSIGMRMMKKQSGGADQFIPYAVNEDRGLIRMKGPDGNLDLIVYFDVEGRVQGIFENGFSEPDQEMEMIAYPIGNSLYYLDGLPYGEESATLKITNNSLTVYQLNRSVSFESK